MNMGDFLFFSEWKVGLPVARAAFSEALSTNFHNNPTILPVVPPQSREK